MAKTEKEELKCKYCGALLKLEDEVCPYCGKPTDHAKEHRKKMGWFQKDYEKTKQDIYKQSHVFTGSAVKVALICLLIMVNLVCLVMCGNTWEIGRQIRMWNVRMNMDDYTTKAKSLEEERKFWEFAHFYEANSLYKISEFDEYRKFQYVANNYGYLYMNIMRGIWTEDKGEYNNREYLAENVSEQLGYVYRTFYEDDREWESEQWKDQHVSAMETAIENIHLLLKIYWNISEEDLKQFPELSNARRQLILEEGLERERQHAE